MRIAFVQTYPVYHDSISTDQFLALRNRDRWMPGIVAADGHTVELWGVGRETSEHHSIMAGFGDYRIRLFAPENSRGPSKFHRSDELLEHARRFEPDLCILKGVDGGAGVDLLNRYLVPASRRFGVVIGGRYYARYLRRADAVFYETDYQREALTNPGHRLWRSKVAPDQLIRLPKSVDTQLFRPIPEIAREFDIVIVARLIRRLKSFAILEALSSSYRVMVVGDGPDADLLRSRYPRVAWIGRVDHARMPDLLNRARILFHPGLREYYPRVLSEAAACGLPSVAFGDAIAPDVLPMSIGLQVDRRDYMRSLGRLLGDEQMLRDMAQNARSHAVNHSGIYSSRQALERLLSLASDLETGGVKRPEHV